LLARAFERQIAGCRQARTGNCPGSEMVQRIRLSRGWPIWCCTASDAALHVGCRRALLVVIATCAAWRGGNNPWFPARPPAHHSGGGGEAWLGICLATDLRWTMCCAPRPAMPPMRVVLSILVPANLLITTPPTGSVHCRLQSFRDAGAGQLVGLPPR